jgi:hypothetical protein
MEREKAGVDTAPFAPEGVSGGERERVERLKP